MKPIEPLTDAELADDLNYTWTPRIRAHERRTRRLAKGLGLRVEKVSACSYRLRDVQTDDALLDPTEPRWALVLHIRELEAYLEFAAR
jgi:hypothetical protein